MDNLMMFIFPIHENSIYFHLLVSSISFFCVYKFLNTVLLPHWLNLFSGILFYFLDSFVNGIFLVSFSGGLLLVYKNATNFWICILYPTTLLNSFINSSRIFGGIFKVLHTQYHVIHKYWQFSFFPFWMLFMFPSCLIAVARTPSNMLDISGGSGHSCLVPELKGNAFSFFSIEYDVDCGFVIYGLYYVEVRSLYSHFTKSSYHKWMLDFVKCFFCTYWYDDLIFVFILSMWYITLINLWVLYNPCIPAINPTWYGEWSFKYIVAFSLLIFFEDFACTFMKDIGL